MDGIKASKYMGELWLIYQHYRINDKIHELLFPSIIWQWWKLYVFESSMIIFGKYDQIVNDNEIHYI